jgi:TolB-like protein
VKGGPEAEVAAFSLGAPAAPVVKQAGRAWFRQPLVLGGIALAAVALVAVIATTMLGSKPAAPVAQTQRIAFFGFTAADADPLSEQVAGVATDETFSALTTFGLETAARGETQDVGLKEQIDGAAKLGARYALGGSVRISGDEIAVTIRLDDVQSRATFWQEKQSGGRDLSVALPVQAAARAVNILDCLISIRSDMARADANALGIVARACDSVVGGTDALTRWREAVGVASKSASAEFGLAVAWLVQSAQALGDDRKTMLEEGRRALARAEAIEPGRPDVRAGVDLVDIASDRPLSAIIDDLNTLLAVGADRTQRRRIMGAVFARLSLLSTVGQFAEAVRLAESDVAADRWNGNLQSSYARTLILAGRLDEGRRLHESVISRFALTTSWAELAYATILERGDFAPVLAAAPSGVSPELRDCLQAVAKASRLSEAKARYAGVRRVMDCVRPEAPQIDAAAFVMGSFGGQEEMDAAFGKFAELLDRSNPVLFGVSGARLFAPQAKTLRADPRFLQLMKNGGKTSIYQYWLDTKTQPDVCATPEERDIEVCRELRKDQGQ